MGLSAQLARQEGAQISSQRHILGLKDARFPEEKDAEWKCVGKSSIALQTVSSGHSGQASEPPSFRVGQAAT